MNNQTLHADREKAQRQDAAYRDAIYKMDAADAVEQANLLGFPMDRLAYTLAQSRPNGRTGKLDAGEAGLLARALIYMKAQSVDVQYAPSKFREIFSSNLRSDVPLGAEQVSTPQFDVAGSFALLGNGSNDLPNVDVIQSEVLNRMFAFGGKFSYTIFDLARAAFSGIPLDTKRQQAARATWERQIDQIAAVGDTATGIKGITNASGIQSVTTNNAGTWQTKVNANNEKYVIDDLSKLCKAIVSTTQGTIEPDTLLLDIDHYALISTSPWSAANASNVTILDFFLKTSPYIKRVVPWARLGTADAGGTGPRVMVVSTRPDVCEFVLNDLTMMAPQPEGLGIEVPMYGRCGGVVAMQPKGLAYMDSV